jgi:hypothetical protein
MNNSQGTGTVFDSGKGASRKGQDKFGGTQAPSVRNLKSQPKTGGTEAPSKRNLKQPKYGGTANPQSAANGSRYANGSSSHDTLRGMIRDH